MKKILLILLSLIISSEAYSFDWSTLSMTPAEKNEESDEDAVFLTDSDSKIYIIENEQKVNDQIATEIAQFIRIAKSWKYIVWKEMKFYITSDGLQFAVYPSKIEYKNEDLLPFIPGGMVFSYEEGAQRYDFRLIKKNTIIKMRGAYIEEEPLLAKISEALNDPKSFMKKRDPDFLLAKIEELENKLDKAETNALSAKIQNDKIAADLIAFQNARMFNSKQFVSADIISRIVELKKADSRITTEEMKKKMDEEKKNISLEEINLIYGVYFNEYKK
ncbi:MAG: hypothetical protein KAZ87_08540 [Spirochaetes bacterium]|nr:hypothetical protein [Spirochaetota bacterium]